MTWLKKYIQVDFFWGNLAVQLFQRLEKKGHKLSMQKIEKYPAPLLAFVSIQVQVLLLTSSFPGEKENWRQT